MKDTKKPEHIEITIVISTRRICVKASQPLSRHSGSEVVLVQGLKALLQVLESPICTSSDRRKAGLPGLARLQAMFRSKPRMNQRPRSNQGAPSVPKFHQNKPDILSYADQCMATKPAFVKQSNKMEFVNQPDKHNLYHEPPHPGPHPACGHLLPSDGRRKLFLDVEPRAASAARTCPGLLSFALAGLRFEFALAPGRWRTATVAQPLPSSL